MLEFLAQYGITSELLVRVLIYTVVLFVIWSVMKFIMRFTLRLFWFGLVAIAVLAVVIVLMRVIGG